MRTQAREPRTPPGRERGSRHSLLPTEGAPNARESLALRLCYWSSNMTPSLSSWGSHVLDPQETGLQVTRLKVLGPLLCPQLPRRLAGRLVLGHVSRNHGGDHGPGRDRRDPRAPPAKGYTQSVRAPRPAGGVRVVDLIGGGTRKARASLVGVVRWSGMPGEGRCNPLSSSGSPGFCGGVGGRAPSVG